MNVSELIKLLNEAKSRGIEEVLVDSYNWGCPVNILNVLFSDRKVIIELNMDGL